MSQSLVTYKAPNLNSLTYPYYIHHPLLVREIRCLSLLRRGEYNTSVTHVCPGHRVTWIIIGPDATSSRINEISDRRRGYSLRHDKEQQQRRATLLALFFSRETKFREAQLDVDFAQVARSPREIPDISFFLFYFIVIEFARASIYCHTAVVAREREKELCK